MESCPFGTALVNLLVGFLLGGLPVCGHVRGLVTEFAGVEEVPRNRLLAHAQLPGLVGGARLLCGRSVLGALKEFDYTGKLQHTLQDLVGMGVISLVLVPGKD